MGGLYANTMFNFVKTAKLSSSVVVPFYIPASHEREFLWLHILGSIWCCQCAGFWLFQQVYSGGNEKVLNSTCNDTKT